MLNAVPAQASSLRRHLWALVNIAVLPPAGMAVLLLVVFTNWIGSPMVFRLRSSLAMLPWVVGLGALLGLVLGLLQGLALRERVPLLRWTLVTGGGMALAAGLAAVAWLLRNWALHPSAAAQLPAWGENLALGGFGLLAVGHGCALAGVQCLALHGAQSAAQPSRRAWLWGAGLTWSLLTPFAYILTEAWWQALALALPLPVDFGGLYLPFLLFALPYVIVTARLWRNV